MKPKIFRPILFAGLLMASVPASAGSFEGSIKESADISQWNPQAPWKLPQGYEQKVVANETNLNIYDNGRSDMLDMITVNETGPDAGKFMYRTHEVEDEKEGGALSVINLETGVTRLLAQNSSWNKVDGIRWTPWGTILFGEEVENGRMFEFILNTDHISGKVFQRNAVGRLEHEGIEIDAEGNIYLVDELRGQSVGCGFTPCGGGIYKFVPEKYGDLSRGKLYVLKIVKGDTVEGTGQAQWAGPINPANARRDGTLKGGQSYQKPEDLEIIGNTLYVALSAGTPGSIGSEKYDGRVLAINLTTLNVSDYVKPGVNVPVEKGLPGFLGYTTGLDNPDNLAESPDGHLMIIEDNVPSDIWIAEGKGPVAEKVRLFASLSDPQAEGTGIYFSPRDKSTLYVNVQNSKASDGDGTWTIRKNFSPVKGK